MLRLTTTGPPASRRLTVEGRLTAAEAHTLRAAWRRHRRAVLDLRWLTYADLDGARTLAELAARGARLEHVPAFIASLLDGGLR